MARIINNSCLGLSNDEYEQLVHLKGILATSWAIRDMIEEWLVEAGLSPAPRGMAWASHPLLVILASCEFTDILISWTDIMNVRDLQGMPCASVAPKSGSSAAYPVGDPGRPGGSEPDRPHKRPKMGTMKMSVSVAARVSTAKVGGSPGHQN